ncbi:hypothetical protein [Rhodococcoides yunnanense]|nr:hypothetical protein [Rhodococcus yunnanensis]
MTSSTGMLYCDKDFLLITAPDGACGHREIGNRLSPNSAAELSLAVSRA